MHPLFRFLKKNSVLYNVQLLNGKPITTDFSKFLIDADGKVRSFYKESVNIEQIKSDIKLLADQQK